MNTRWMQWTLGAALAAGIVGPSFLTVTHADPPASTASATAETRHFGASFAMTEVTPFADLVSKPEAFDGKTVHVEAKVSSVCKKKGCWMVLGDPTGTRPETVRITMKDYGFFVPRDCDGAKAIVEGVFAQKVLSEAMAKHYAEDAGKDPSKEAARKELSLVATGVSITAAAK